MGKIRNFLCFFICSFHLNCPTMEEQITDRQVLLGVTRNIVQASEEEKFLFILPSAADVRTLKYCLNRDGSPPKSSYWRAFSL